MKTFLKFRTATAALSIVALTSASAFAGGLADPIIEGELEDNIGAVQEDSASSLPGWVLPVVAVVAIGAIIASSDDDDDDNGAAAPTPGPTAGGDGADPAGPTEGGDPVTTPVVTDGGDPEPTGGEDGAPDAR